MTVNRAVLALLIFWVLYLGGHVLLAAQAGRLG